MSDAGDTRRPSGATTPGGSRQDLVLGCAITGLGLLLWLWIIPAQIDDSGAFGLPPSLAPRALAWIIMGCGLVLVVQNLRYGPRPFDLRLADLVFLTACVAAVGLMLWGMQRMGAWIDRPFAGFLIAAPLGLLAFTALHGRAPLWAYAVNALAAPAVIYAGFWWGLQLPLP